MEMAIQGVDPSLILFRVLSKNQIPDAISEKQKLDLPFISTYILTTK